MYFTFIFLLFFSWNSPPTIEAAKQPNFLLLFPDQWRFDWGTGIHIPNVTLPLKVPFVDSLRKKGTHFTQTYVAAPVCAPSRSCLASGREYDHAGVACNFCNDYPIDQTTFYTVLQQAGYWTMTTGKDDLTKKHQPGGDGEFHRKELGWSDALRASGKMDVVSGKNPHEPYGFYLNNQTVDTEKGKKMSGWEAHYDCMKKKGPCDSSSFPDELYEDNWTTRNALELLSRKPKGQPWFLQISFPGPHPPFLVTSRMHDEMDNRTFPKPVDSSAEEDVCVKTGEPSNGFRCDYASEIENLDMLMKNITNYVEELGELDDTIIIFASDHGEMLGDHNDHGKTMPWQGSASVPMIFVGKGIQEGVELSVPVTILDLGGTFMDYAGTKPAPGMTTQSLRPLLEGKKQTRTHINSGLQSGNFNSTNLLEYVPDTENPDNSGYNWRMVVKQYNESTTLKFICCIGKCKGAPSNIGPPVDGWTQLLYNTVADPFDMNNLANDHPHEVNELRSLLPTTHWECGKNSSSLHYLS